MTTQQLTRPRRERSRSGARSRGRLSESTNFHLQRAVAADPVSLAWLMTRLTPFLRLQARYRLRGCLRRIYDPDDLVNDVWAVILPRLGDLRERDGSLWPVLLRFLGTTLLHRANQLLARELSRQGSEGHGEGSGPSPLDQLPAPLATASSLAEHNELLVGLSDALAGLEEEDRQVIVLRLIEQVPNVDAAQLLGVTPGAVSKRLKAALERIRQRLHASALGEPELA